MCAVCFTAAQAVPVMAMSARAMLVKRRQSAMFDAELDALLDESDDVEVEQAPS